MRTLRVFARTGLGLEMKVTQSKVAPQSFMSNSLNTQLQNGTIAAETETWTSKFRTLEGKSNFNLCGKIDTINSYIYVSVLNLPKNTFNSAGNEGT